MPRSIRCLFALSCMLLFASALTAQTKDEPKKSGPFEFRKHDVPGDNAFEVVKMLRVSIKDPSVRIMESGTSRIFVYADKTTHEYIEKKLRGVGEKSIAQPKKNEPAKSDGTLQIYPTPSGAAEAVAKLLQELFPAPSTRIAPSGMDRIVVWADAKTHAEIAKQRALQLPPTVTEVIPMTSVDVLKTAEMLKALLTDAERKGLAIVPDVEQNALVLRGQAEQVREVLAVLNTLGLERGPAGNVRVVHLDKNSAATIADAIKTLFVKLRQNEVQLILPAAVDSAPKKKTSPKKDAEAAKALPTVILTALGNRLVVRTEDKEAMTLVLELARMLQAPTTGDFEVIRLQFAKATHVAQILDEAFNHSGPRSFGGGFGGGGFGGGRGKESANLGRIHVVADPMTNALLLRASALDSLTIRSLLRTLDTTDVMEIEKAKDRKK